MNDSDIKRTTQVVSVVACVLQVAALAMGLLRYGQMGENGVSFLAGLTAACVSLCLMLLLSRNRVNYRARLRGGRLRMEKEVHEFDDSGMERLGITVLVVAVPLSSLLLVGGSMARGVWSTILTALAYVLLGAGVVAACVLSAIPSVRKRRSR